MGGSMEWCADQEERALEEAEAKKSRAIMSEETPEEVANAKLREFGILFSRLLESPRFQELMSTYFTFTKAIDEETKEIDYSIIENPPEVVAAKMREKMKDGPQIEVVSGAKAAAVLRGGKKRRKN